MRLMCNEIIVKFSKPERNTQRIRFSMGGTTAQKLGVEDDGHRLIVKFFDKQGFVTKLLVWPIDEIHEYDCTEIDRPTTVEPGKDGRPAPLPPSGKGA